VGHRLHHRGSVDRPSNHIPFCRPRVDNRLSADCRVALLQRHRGGPAAGAKARGRMQAAPMTWWNAARWKFPLASIKRQAEPIFDGYVASGPRFSGYRPQSPVYFVRGLIREQDKLAHPPRLREDPAAPDRWFESYAGRPSSSPRPVRNARVRIANKQHSNRAPSSAMNPHRACGSSSVRPLPRPSTSSQPRSAHGCGSAPEYHRRFSPLLSTNGRCRNLVFDDTACASRRHRHRDNASGRRAASTKYCHACCGKANQVADRARSFLWCSAEL